MKAHPHESPHHPHWPLAALVFGLVLLLGLFSIHESSTWQHVATGGVIAETGRVPRTDPFSYTAGDRAWSTDSWLSDLIFHRLHAAFGPRGLVAAKAALLAGAYASLLPLNYVNPIVSAAILGLAAAVSWAGFSEKPAAFDLLMLAFFIRLLRPRKRFHWAMVGWAAAAEALWANLHGPAAALGVWLVALKTIKTSLKAEPGERLGYPAMLGACALALTVNPSGLGVVGSIFGPSSAAVDPWAVSWAGPYALFAAAAAWACWVCLQQEFFLSITAATLLAFSALFPSLRPHFLLASAPVLTLAAGHYLRPLSDTLSRVARLAAAFGLLLAWHWSAVSLSRGRTRGYGAASLDGALNYLRANGVTGRLFNDPEAGDFLLGTGRPVFIDSRPGVYEPAFVRDALGWSGRLAALDEIYRFDYAVVLNRRGAYPARALDAEPWRLAYADDWALVYLKRTGTNAWLLGQGGRTGLAPNQLWPASLDGPLREPKRAARLLEELDRWIVQSPDSAQALLWKAYALDRLKLSEKAQRLLALVERRPGLRWDGELAALHAFVLEARGQKAEALAGYRRAARLAGAQRDPHVEAAVLERLAVLQRESGREWDAVILDQRARDLRRLAEAKAQP